jgi:hypothetical protein
MFGQKRKNWLVAAPMAGVACGLALGMLLASGVATAHGNYVMGELQFSASTKDAWDSGVWIDKQYVGYLKELKGDKKIMLMPGGHEVCVRQAGYDDFTKSVTVEPGATQKLQVALERNPQVGYPGEDAARLRLGINPGRSAVFMDDNYIGHADDFGGSFHFMVLNPGKHRIKVELPGYRTFETEINVLPGQKTELKAGLIKGSIQQASALIRRP